MSELHPRHDIPDTMTFTDEERALARQKQQEAAAAKKKRRNRILASVAGGATLIGGGVVAGLSLGGGSNPAPERNPAASATPNPGSTAPSTGETTTPSPEVKNNLEKFGIVAADYPTFDEAVKAYYAKVLEYEESSSDTYDQPGDPQYLNALFGADWESNPELADYVKYMQDGSVIISTNHYATGENGDPEYQHNIEVTDVRNTTQQNGQIAGEVTIHSTDNVMETVLAANSSTGVDLDSYGNFHLTFTNKDGLWVVTEVDNLDNNK